MVVPDKPRRPSPRLQLAVVVAAACLAGAAATWLALPPPPRGGASPHAHTPFSLPLPELRFAYDLARLELPTLVSKLRRLLSAQLALAALLNGVPGDFVETGVFTGGTSILMAKALERHDPAWAEGAGDGAAGGGAHDGRRLWAADSFQGTPAPVDQDVGGSGRTGFKGEYASSLDTFKANLATWGMARHLHAGRLQILQGWFNETLAGAPIQRIAFLRLDGDLYVSTRDALDALYDRLSPGGLVYVDDYGSYTGCQRAVNEFRERRGITAPLNLQAMPEQVLFAPPGDQTMWAAAWWVKEPHERTRPPLLSAPA